MSSSNQSSNDSSIYTAITPDSIDFSSWIKWAKHPKAGAVVYFGGITRDSFEGKHVRSLAYDAYVPRAEKTLNDIAQWATTCQGVQKVVLIHRTGIVPLSEDSVCIVVSASHRKEAWVVAEEILERVKRTAEIWKKEEFEDGDQKWIEGVKRETKTTGGAVSAKAE